jgi:hypothetical protein
MSKRAKTKKTRIRKASSYVNNSKRQESQATRDEQINAMLAGQKFVDTWNSEYVGNKGMKGQDITSHFDNIQLEDGMVIQMYMENPIKEIARNSQTGEVVHLDYYIRQIDARKQQTDQPTWVPSPFPVISKAIIMAIAPRTKMWYHEQQEKLAKYDKKAAKDMIIPEVGDTIYTKHMMFKDKRYYVNKQDQCKDMVKNQMEVRLKEFDFLFLIENYDIQSIVKRGSEASLGDAQVAIDSRYVEIDPSELQIPEDVIQPDKTETVEDEGSK